MSDKYFVISGNVHEFSVFIKKKCEELYAAGNTDISYSHFVYVADIFSLKGYSNPTGWFIGTWRERKDIDEIIVQLLMAKNGFTKTEEFSSVLEWFRSKG
jgi:hypothetical protein